MKTRREFLISSCAGLFLVATSLAALAQQGKLRRIGFFYFGTRQSAIESGRHPAFLDGMRRLGYVQGKDLVMEERFADGKAEILPGLAAELVQSKVELIVATGSQIYAALKSATKTVPVVITTTANPIGEGLAVTLARPGGNFTGLSTANIELIPKHIELLRAAVPKLSRLAVLWNPSNPGHPARLNAMRAAASDARVQALEVSVLSPEEIERGFASMSKQRVEALVGLNDTFFVQQSRQIASLAIKHRLPSIHGTTEYPEDGGFMGYGQNIVENFRTAAIFVDKILKGARPAELPFEQPMRLELVINRKTAKAIGLAIPQELLLRADKVIE